MQFKIGDSVRRKKQFLNNGTWLRLDPVDRPRTYRIIDIVNDDSTLVLNKPIDFKYGQLNPDRNCMERVSNFPQELIERMKK